MTRKGQTKYRHFRREDGTVDYAAARAYKKERDRKARAKDREERREKVLKYGRRVDDHLACPVCLRMVPLHVKTFMDGTPIKQKEKGIFYFKGRDGLLQRRFAGPPVTDPFYVVVSRFSYGSYGTFINTDLSSEPDDLRIEDKLMFSQFRSTLRRTLEYFEHS